MLKVCAQGEAAWTVGGARGKHYDLDKDCAAFNPNAPGARVWVVKFGDAAARAAAWLRFMTHRRGLGTAYAWTHGPPLIMVDGPQTPDVIAAVKDAVTGIGAQ